MIATTFKRAITIIPFLFAFFLLTHDKASAQTVHENYLDGRIFVKVAPNVDLKGETSRDSGPANVDITKLSFLDGYLDRFDVTKVERPFHNLQGEAPDLKRTYRVHFDAAQKVGAFVRKLSRTPQVEMAEKEPLKKLSYTPNDNYYSNNDQWFLPQVNASGAWDISFGSSSVTIAITDSEIDTAHDDLNGVLWKNPGEIPGDGVDNDGNGYVDDYRGYDVGENDADPTYSGAAQKHGTHVAGLSGAETDNNTGVASIGFGVSIMAVKISDGSGALTAGYDGITYAADQGAEVINMSWGSSSSSSTGANAVSYAKNQGSYLVGAAGNDGVNTKHYPAAYPEVLAVAATNKADEKASFSQYGSWVDIAAPGVSMNSTWDPNTYYNTQGTSMASPLTAGLVGLMLSHNPSLSHSKITNCLKSTAVAVQGSYSGQVGAGRIDAKAAMNCVDATVSTAKNDAGIANIDQPKGDRCDTIFDPAVVLKNYGDSTLNNVDIKYRIDNGSLLTYNWTGSLSKNSTANITLPTMDTTAGSYTFTAYTVNPNTMNDTVNGNDTATASFTILDGNQVTLHLDADCFGSDIGWLIRDTATGTIIDSVGNGAYQDKTGGWTKTIDLCLPDACYEFRITDAYGDGLAGSQYGSCSIDGDYYIIDNNTGDTLADMGSDPNYGSDTSHYFCVPQGPGPPSADFTANQTTVPVGGTVDFTDLSNGNPAPNSWSWTFNSGTPNSSTNQNPNGVQYNTAGTYDVSLTVSNGNGTDTETKNGYIEVVASNPNCDTLDQIQAGDSVAYYDLSGSGCNWGYFPGHNGCNMLRYADSMATSTLSYVNAALVPIGKAVNGGPLSSIKVKVWDDNGGVPGAVLDSESVQISDLVPFSYNKVHFTTPAQVNGKFFIGYEMNYGNGDTVSIYTAQDRGVGAKNTTFLDDGTGWTSVENVFTDFTTSMYTQALISTGQPDANFSFNPSNICLGDSAQVDGSSSVNVNGWRWLAPKGSPDTTYGQSASIGFNSRGTHDVTLEAFGSCTVDSITKSVSVKAPVLDSLNKVDASGCGASDGEIHLFASKGFAPYQYSIDSGSSYKSSNDFTGLTGGVYDIAVKDDNGCMVRDTLHVDPISGVSIDNVNVTDEQTCSGGDGEIEMIASSGATPYEYSKNGGAYQSGNTFAGLSSGSYGLKVKDANGCTDSTTVFVDSIPTPQLDAVNVTDVQSCGGSDGEISVTASGGTTPYEYSKDSGNTYQGSSSFTGLSAGPYHVMVRDSNSCTSVADSVYVDPKPAPKIDSISRSNVTSCTNDDGSMDIFAIDGTTPYEYSKDSGSSYQSSSQFTGLSDSIYDVMVRDANGCTAYDTVHITAPDNPSIDSVNVQDISCNGAGDGEAHVHATNATSYNIDGGAYQGSNSFTGLSAGSHKMVAKNSSGCKDSTQIMVSEPAQLLIDSVDADTSYCGSSSGALTIYASGGSGSYTYSKDNGSNFNSSKSFTNLATGSYDLVVKDDSGCTASMTDDVPGSASLNVSVTTADDSCNDNEGYAVANVSGGTAPYTYDWSVSGSGDSIGGLGQNNYHVVVTDPNGCQDSVNFSIYNNGSVSASVTPQQTTICDGDTVTLSASGGSSYTWTDQGGTVLSNGSSVAVYPSSSSEYYATVTNSGCSEIDTAIVNVDQIPTTQVDPKDTSICEGDSVSLIASGGQSYDWNIGDTSSSVTVAPTNTSSYSVIASNGNCQGNLVSTDVIVDQNAKAVANANDTVVALINGAKVYFDNGGSIGTSYQWDFGDGTSATTTDTSHSYGSVGTYDVVLTATINNCVDKDTITVHVNERSTSIQKDDKNSPSVEVYPNPTPGRFDVELSLPEKEELSIEVLNSMGAVIRDKELAPVREHREGFDLSGRSTGIYYVRVSGDHGTSVHKVSVIR